MVLLKLSSYKSEQNKDHGLQSTPGPQLLSRLPDVTFTLMDKEYMTRKGI
jgi:hypothetical protein